MRNALLFSFGAASILAFSAARQGRNFDQVEVKVIKVSGSVSMLEGAGGNIAVSAGDDGVLMVDSQFAELEPKIRAAIATLSKKPIRILVNTHLHGDHTGGNVKFGVEAVIVAHENVRRRLAEGGRGGPPARESLPVVTFDDHVSIHFNGEEVKIYHVKSGHTDTDSIIHFTGSNVIHTGDDFLNGRLPFIDKRSGGRLQGFIDAAEKVLAVAKPDVKIIPGHGALATLDDVKRFAGLLKDARKAVADAVKENKTLDDVKKLPIWEGYKKYAWNFISTDAFVEAVFDDVKSQAGK
jgi:glyoxylase-like metal-dependent hydrolase (beta-lactamase superfamily II)